MKPVLAKLKHLKNVRLHHLSFLLVCLATVLALCGAWLWLKPAPTKGLIRTTGSVTGINTRITASSSSIMYYAVISFQTADGAKLTFNGEAYPKPIHRLDQHVPIGYNKANPRYARDLSRRPPSVGAWTFGILTLIAIVLAAQLHWHFHLTLRRHRNLAGQDKEEPGEPAKPGEDPESAEPR